MGIRVGFRGAELQLRLPGQTFHFELHKDQDQEKQMGSLQTKLMCLNVDRSLLRGGGDYITHAYLGMGD